MRLLSFVAVVSSGAAQYYTGSTYGENYGQYQGSYTWQPFLTAPATDFYTYPSNVQTNQAISLSATGTVGCNACTGSGCPTGQTCQRNNLAYNPQACMGVCMTAPDTSNYYSGTGYYDVTVDPYNLFNAYHTPDSSYNTPPDWGRCYNNNDCLSCVSLNGCAWSGTYCAISGDMSCTGGGCAFQARQCPALTPGTCAGTSTCNACAAMAGCAWTGSTCYLAGAPCTTFGCANSPSQCDDTGNVVPQQCGVNEVWVACGSSNCHEDNCQDYYNGNNRICQNDCWSGCQCAPGGFARLGSTCVPNNQCPGQYYGYNYGR